MSSTSTIVTTVIATGLTVGLGVATVVISQVGGLRDDHREDIMQIRQEMMELREAVNANGKVLARIEQALFGPPPKITPADNHEWSKE